MAVSSFIAVCGLHRPKSRKAFVTGASCRRSPPRRGWSNRPKRRKTFVTRCRRQSMPAPLCCLKGCPIRDSVVLRADAVPQALKFGNLKRDSPPFNNTSRCPTQFGLVNAIELVYPIRVAGTLTEPCRQDLKTLCSFGCCSLRNAKFHEEAALKARSRLGRAESVFF